MSNQMGPPAPQQDQHQSQNQNQHPPRNQNQNNRNNRGGGRRNDRSNAPQDQDGRPRRGNYHNSNNHNRPHNRFNNKPASGFNHLITARKDHAGVSMTGNVTDCLICCQPSDVFGVGECQHPVCMECCIRMRVLGSSESCPQCRSPITLLYFVSAPVSWTNFTIPLDDVKHKDSAKYNLRFTNEYTSKCYDSYMAHSCQVCAEKGEKIEFPTFGALRHHTNQMHQRTFCPICIEHLNVLSKDRIAYTKVDLDRHMKGTKNEISGQKGHPPCMYCPERFFDDDHLYRHLRKEHYFCQICENDGGHNIFYPKVEELYHHYRKKHHPCTEPDCLAMGIVFKTDVELGVHKASEHGNASRNVNIDFQFSGRNLGHRNPRSGAQNETPMSRRQERISVVPDDTPAPAPAALPSRIVPSAQAPQVKLVRPSYQTTDRDFPTLGPSAPSLPPPSNLPNWRQEVQAVRRPASQPYQPPLQLNSGEQFPSLGPKNNNKAGNNTVWGKGKPIQLFTSNQPAPSKQPTAAPEPPRRQFVPLPDIWPEGMRERVEAKLKGLPDPGPQEPETLDPLFRVEAAKKEKRRAAKKKSKTVPVSAFANMEDNETVIHTSKFDALAELDERKNKPKNKATSSTQGDTNNFVKIVTAPTLRSVAASIGSSSSPSENVLNKENGTGPSSAPPPPTENLEFPVLNARESVFPSLTDLVRNLWSSEPPSQPGPSTQPSSTTPTSNKWSTGPPPGFS